ncbi:phosphate-starvation-inducible PsiE family protein [Leptolyngbya sp. FACHB-711]|jgi:uncharacterized membrane protein (DUF373 family)|uniref:phosphate-starvation-inducible PsiE family protein n=1 Tax=unclassified Leptolyngbya TaxID=2650499 RepID=UPI001688DE89|nr:phosphate-starvation-inducible PsiE family protein [Leptolyngbya sp. FACHB-711]MBD1852775.1 phosphate-starvation-inducible PsiE family protein [Cyanobacteria bacterium FACHB-502]MBD2023883.1 phosphate-starvation-inducible PsiE family protein [Leptolyngbya sp. FACHB-711]
MNPWQQFTQSVRSAVSDDGFLSLLKKVETWVAKILSIAMTGVIFASVTELFIFLLREVWFNNKLANPDEFFTVTLLSMFGLFLNILIALELLENITAYLRKHVVQLELVIVTSLTAVARKIIIFDFNKTGGLELMALALAIFALSISYWIVRRNRERQV